MNTTLILHNFLVSGLKKRTYKKNCRLYGLAFATFSSYHLNGFVHWLSGTGTCDFSGSLPGVMPVPSESGAVFISGVDGSSVCFLSFFAASFFLGLVNMYAVK